SSRRTPARRASWPMRSANGSAASGKAPGWRSPSPSSPPLRPASAASSPPPCLPWKTMPRHRHLRGRSADRPVRDQERCQVPIKPSWLPVLVLLLLASLAGAQERAAGSIEPPKDATLLCSGHVTGEPSPESTPGPHILWTAYSSRKTTATVAAEYSKSLGTQNRSKEGKCEIWRFPSTNPKNVLEVCPVTPAG